METGRRLSDLRVNPFTTNFNYFDQYLANHREHQIEALIAAHGADKGQIVSPCGTGKTRIQISLHVQEMIDLTKDSKCGIFVIASHRLSLNRQLLGQLVEVAVNCGLPFDVLYLGSYKCDLVKYYAKYLGLGYTPKVSSHLATTISAEIEQFVAAAKANNRHVIIASTYDSFARLKNIGPINLVTFDEAHNTLQDDFSANISVVKPQLMKEYYFTATRKVTAKGIVGGMDNENFYGKVLYDIIPKLMISRGEIVFPRLHIVKGSKDQTTNTSNTGILVKNTIEAFFNHRGYVKDDSISPNDIGAKLLVGCNSIEEMLRIYNDVEIRALAQKNVHVFAISSDGCYVNWNKCSKEEFFTKLGDEILTDPEDALIFNVDMLTEGIDLPGITGVMPYRNLGQTKLIQLIGRALRLHKIDRKRIYSGELEAGDYKNYVKPYGHFIVPENLSTINDYPEMIKTANLFYSEYGTRAEELVIQDKYVPMKAETLDSMIPYSFKDGKDYDLEHECSSLINEINLSNFTAHMKTLTPTQQAEYIRNLK